MRLRATAVLVVLLAVFGSPAFASALAPATAEGRRTGVDTGAAHTSTEVDRDRSGNGTGVERAAIIDPVAQGIRQCAASSECLGGVVGTIEFGIASGAGSKLTNLTKPGLRGSGKSDTVVDAALGL